MALDTLLDYEEAAPASTACQTELHPSTSSSKDPAFESSCWALRRRAIQVTELLHFLAEACAYMHWQ